MSPWSRQLSCSSLCLQNRDHPQISSEQQREKFVPLNNEGLFSFIQISQPWDKQRNSYLVSLTGSKKKRLK